MSVSNHTLQSPYGAYELKARYQRNLLIGTLFATSLVLVLLGIGALLISEPPLPGGGGGYIRSDVWTQHAWINQQLSIKRQKPKLGSQPAREVVRQGVIPRPVDDSLVFDDDDITLPSEYEGTGGPVMDGGMPGLGDGIGSDRGGVAPIVDEWPKPTDVIFREIEPSLVYEYVPEYPRQAKLLGLEGRVFIQALIDTLGGVLQAQVGKSSGVSVLDEAAVRAAYKNRYTPAIQNGRPVMLWVTYDVEFILGQR